MTDSTPAANGDSSPAADDVAPATTGGVTPATAGGVTSSTSVGAEALATKCSTLRELIDCRAEHAGTQTVLIDAESGQSIDYARLQVEVQAVADFIAVQGVAPGQSVAFAMHNGRSCVVTILGILYGGFRAVAINLVAGRDVIAFVLAHSESALVLVQDEYASLINDALGSDAFDAACEPPAIVVMNDRILDECIVQRQTPPSPRLRQGARSQTSRHTDPAARSHQATQTTDNRSDALLMYTSGTTGAPKGVVLSHGNLLAGGSNVCVGHELNSSDRALCVLPLYHINGLCVTLFGPLVSAGSVVMPQRFSTSGFWGWIDRYRCTWFSVVPTQIAYLLRDVDDEAMPRTFLRFGRSASAPLSPDVHRHFEARFGVPLIETMGLTETAAQILSNPMPPGQRKIGSPGLPVGDELRIVDRQCKDVERGCEGELLVRGANVMQRYYRNEAATRDAIVQGGWLRTGDLGRQDEEGYVFITGRLKELIIKGGENIAPREIDDALYQHADVVEAAAFARPCERFGQRVEAAVCVKASSAVSEATLIELCTERLGAFKCPDRIHFLAELPKGPSGKIQRQRLLELVSQ